MPRPTKQVKELRDYIAFLEQRHNRQGVIENGMRADLRGAVTQMKHAQDQVDELNKREAERQAELQEMRSAISKLMDDYNAACRLIVSLITKDDD